VGITTRTTSHGTTGLSGVALPESTFFLEKPLALSLIQLAEIEPCSRKQRWRQPCARP